MFPSHSILERDVARLVEDAYGLSREERQLMHETRPIRDPLDVLEAKIAGRIADTETIVEDGE